MRSNFVTRWGGWLAMFWLLAHCPLTTSLNAQVIARPVTLGWQAASDPSVRGYALYYGRTNQTSPTRIDSRTNVVCTISNLLVGTTYRIYAVSYDAQGLESIPSNQLLFTPTQPATPAGTRLQITRLASGNMKLDAPVGTNKTCALQFAATPNAKYWQTLTNITANSAGNITVTDFSASRVPQRYYRVALTPQPLVSPVAIQRQPNGAMRLTWLTPPKAVCRVQYAATPRPSVWLTMATVTANDEGVASYTDAFATNAPSRFYRVALP